MISSDKMGMVEYWTGPRHDYAFPKNATLESKIDTDLYEFAKVGIYTKFYCFAVSQFFTL